MCLYCLLFEWQLLKNECFYFFYKKNNLPCELDFLKYCLFDKQLMQRLKILLP